MFCVECGKETDRTVDGACVACFIKDRRLIKLPHHVDLQLCTNCEEFRLENAWVQKEVTDAVEDTALTKLSSVKEARILSVGTRSTQLDTRTYKVDIEVDLEIRGTEVRADGDTLVRLKNTVCKRCSRQLGNYYEATIQLRSDSALEDSLRDEVIRRVRNEVESHSKNDRGIFITSVQEVAGGVDIKISSTALGKTLTRELADRYGAETKESFSLVGQAADGSEMYRVTFLVRLPSYRAGDAVMFDGKPYKLLSLGKQGGKLLALRGFREISVRKPDMVRVKTIRKKDEMRTATVVFSQPGETQILHPVTYETVSILTPERERISETVRFVDVDGEILYFP